MSTPGTLNFPTSLNDSTSLFEAANRASTTLASTLSAGATSAVLTSAALFPSSGAFTVDEEVIYFTGKSTNTLTGLIRGRQGTSDASHASTTPVKMRITKGHHEALRGAIIALETKFGIGSSTPTIGNFLTSSANGSSAWGHAIGSYPTIDDTAWGTTGATGLLFQGSDANAANPSTSQNPSMAFQTTRSGGTQGEALVGYGFSLTNTGKRDAYGLYMLQKYTANMTGYSAGAYNQHAGRDYLIGAPTNIPGGANVHIYGRWIQAERSVTGIRIVGAQIDSNNNASDAAVSTSSIDTCFNIATNYTSTGHSTGIIYSQGFSYASAYAGWYVDSNAVCQRILDFTSATVTLQGTWAATNGSPTVTGSGGHAAVELVAGDIILVNSVNVTVSSATANSITLTANFSGSTGSGLTITKKVQPAWFANNSYLWWQNAAASARYRLVGLNASDGWEFDPDGRHSSFGGSIFIGAPASVSLTAAGFTDSLHLRGADATANLLVMDAYGTAAFGALTGRAARGTAASPSAVQFNDIIFTMAARPYGATGFAAGGRAAISFKAAENATDSAQGSYITHECTPRGSTSRGFREFTGLDATLTDAATSLFEIALASGAMSGGQIIWTIVASDGTDHQAFSGSTNWAAVNKAGTYTKTFTNNASNDAKAVSSGTLTVAWAGVDGTNKITVTCQPTGSLTETTYKIYYKIIINATTTITLL